MKKFREYISEEVVPSALVANGTIDIDNEDVRASINLALAKVTADGAITPYIALNRISKALSYFHIILPKRIYLEGAKGVEVHEIRQFGHKMGMTDQGEFVHEVPGKYYLFLQYGMNNAMPYGGQLAYPNMGGTFRVMAKVVDKIELDRLVSMAELALAEECDAEMQQKRAKMLAPHETMHDVTSDEKKVGNKAAVEASEKKKVNESASRNPAGAMAIRRNAKAMTSRDSDEITKKYPNAHRPKSDKWAEDMKARRIAADAESKKRYDKKHSKKEDVKEGAVGDFVRSMNPFGQLADRLGTGGAQASPKPDMRIMTPSKPVEKKQSPKEGSPQSSFPSVNEEKDSDRRRKYAQIKLGRAHKGEEGWNDKVQTRAAAIKMGRKLQKQGVMREEEQIDELKKPTPETALKVVNRATDRDEWSAKAANRLYSRYKKGYEPKEKKTEVKEDIINEISHKLALKAMKKSEKRSDDEYEADQAYDRLSDYKTHEDRAKRLRGHMRKKFGNNKPGRGTRSYSDDRLGDGGGEGRTGVLSVNKQGKRAGLPPKEQVNRLKSNIKFSLGKHHKPNLPESYQLDEVGDTSKGREALKSYIKKAALSASAEASDYNRLQARTGLKGYATSSEIKRGEKHIRKHHNRHSGINKAVDRLEETQIDELKKPTPETALKVVNRATDRDEWSAKAANRLYSRYKKGYEPKEKKPK